jgi:pimeloyl-ACP methyl ester carboxylesterase
LHYFEPEPAPKRDDQKPLRGSPRRKYTSRMLPTPTGGDERPAIDAVPFSSALLPLEGVELWVDRWSGGRRAHVLLLHGLGGNSVTWHGVAPVLARSLEADVLAVDLPGFGRSRTSGRTLDLPVLSALLEALLREQAAPGSRWVLAGNSLGAVLSLELACRVPELVARVSLLSPALPLVWGRGLRGVAALAAWLPASVPWLGGQLVARYMRRTGVPGIVDGPIRALFGDPARLDGGLRERLLGVSANRLEWASEAARAYEQVTRSLGVALLMRSRVERWIRDTACPVQAIRGGRDPIFPESAWQRLEQVRPDWHYRTLPDIGHVPQLEAPREVAQCLLEWMTTSFTPAD